MKNVIMSLLKIYGNYWGGISKGIWDFSKNLNNSTKMVRPEPSNNPWQEISDFFDSFALGLQIAEEGAMGSVEAARAYHSKLVAEAMEAYMKALMSGSPTPIGDLVQAEADALETVVNAYPKAIKEIEPKYGFKLNGDGYKLMDEDDCFCCYQVLPNNGITVRENGKPVLILPPYVLGPNILAFLPGQGRSFVHNFANKGIPTYIRIVKDIQTIVAVQEMKREDDCLGTKKFCETIAARHGKMVTLTGYCQGGFMAALDVLSGELDHVVDALITCVAPMDGTRSKTLCDFMDQIPVKNRGLEGATKILANGNRVIDGSQMSFLFKLKAMESRAPIPEFYQQLATVGKAGISEVAAAINYWLLYDKVDIPLEITRLSHISYSKPVYKNGKLPVKMFGRNLNFKRINEMGIRWLICVAGKDDLVDGDAALAPLDYVDSSLIKVVRHPKGHASLATDRYDYNFWSYVQFHMELDDEYQSF